MEVRRYGVRVGLMLPPDTDTPMLAEENKHKPAETRAISEGWVTNARAPANWRLWACVTVCVRARLSVCVRARLSVCVRDLAAVCVRDYVCACACATKCVRA